MMVVVVCVGWKEGEEEMSWVTEVPGNSKVSDRELTTPKFSYNYLIICTGHHKSTNKNPHDF